MVSGVPQLGPLLFLVYINDLDIGISSKTPKFADDTKIASTVQGLRTIIGCKGTWIGWADRWQMESNSRKCQVMHIGKDIIGILAMRWKEFG